MINFVRSLFSCGSRTAKGVAMIQEMDEGQSCLSCKDKCPGFSLHTWRKTCQFCRCPREVHDVGREEGFYGANQWTGWELLFSRKDPISSANRKKRAVRFGYAWVPLGIPKEKVDVYMQKLDSNKIPKLGSVGEKHRILQLITQLPKSDLSIDRCRNLKTTEQKQHYENFCRIRDAEAMDVGQVKECAKANMVCRKCDGQLSEGELAVFAPKVGDNVSWHVTCFTCSVCQELLVDLIYCQSEGLIYCERHFAQINRPRCFACDELIFSAKYSKAMDHDWHEGHFACFQCDLSLSGQRYIKSEDQPYCVKCYETLFAHVCEECKTIIGTGSKDLSYQDMHWHEKCFKCIDCQTSLVNMEFATVNNKLFCSECHDNNFAARCDACGQVFRSGMKKYEYEGKKWHENCFTCTECHERITNNSFVPREDKIYCSSCFEKRFAQRCTKCKEVIQKGGLTFKDTAWHRECFTCTQCVKTLAGEKFTSQEEKPYCADCYSQLFAKKCFLCSEAITGLGKTKFVTFENRHWHSDCFKCHRCSISLVGKGFLLDGIDVLCPQCSADAEEEGEGK